MVIEAGRGHRLPLEGGHLGTGGTQLSITWGEKLYFLYLCNK